MKRVLSSELLQFIDQPVELRGWLNNLRPFGKINFLILRDRAGLSQIVIEDREELRKIAHLQPGSILKIAGTAVRSSHAELGVEVIKPLIEVEVPILEVPPIEYYKPEVHSDLDFILDHRPIALRNRQIQAVFVIQAELVHAFRLYMHDTVKAVEYFAPNILGASSEGGSEFFNVDYFGYPATLAQSSQLYKQIMVGVNERVFALMPFFRAENSNTTRHLSEGKQFEFEMGFFDDWHDILSVQEGCLKFMIEYLNANSSSAIKELGGRIIKAPKDIPFPRLTFAEAQELYFKRTGRDERQESDLSPAAEKELCSYAMEEFGTELIFITDWLMSKRPFYAYPNDANPALSNTFDLLCAGTEITSGGQRRHTYSSMVEGILSKGMDPASFTDYLSIFKYGMPPHGGFGMGLERLTMTILGLKNIREASLFPSDPKRIAGNRIKAKIFFGGENVRNEIIRLIKHGGMDYRLGIQTDENPDGTISVKSLILRGKSSRKNYLVTLLAHMKVDMKAVAEQTGEKCDFEDAGTLQERFGLSPASIPPFGHLLNIDTFFDERVFNATRLCFNCGTLGESVVLDSKDLISLAKPKLGCFAKE